MADRKPVFLVTRSQGRTGFFNVLVQVFVRPIMTEFETK